MKSSWKAYVTTFLFFLSIVWVGGALAASQPTDTAEKSFPRSLESYDDSKLTSITSILKNRIQKEPFNLFATLIFLCAIIHTFMTSRFLAISHKWEHDHQKKIKQGLADKNSVHHGAELFHFMGEVEAVFGIWAMALVCTVIAFYDWATAVNYISYNVNFTEACFVVVIMALASTRPILKITELIMWKIANLLKGTLTAWWFTILTIGPLLGSLITEPAAMTISALLLANKFYEMEPSDKFKYATIGLLFVNISIGGTLTHFAAPPVLMVAGPWDWGLTHMAVNFGIKALVGILISNGVYFLIFRKELARLQEKFAFQELEDEIQKKFLNRKELDAEFDNLAVAVDKEVGFIQAFDRQTAAFIEQIKNRLADRLKVRHMPTIEKEGIDQALVKEAFEKRFEEIKLAEMRKTLPGLLPESDRANFVDPEWDDRDDPVPGWVVLVHVLFMAWTIINAHHPEMFIPGLLFFLGFAQVTSPYQNRINLKPPLLVGFFLGGLVIHGGVQGWWIAPVLGSLAEIPLMLAATVLTAFNDNAAITFLSTLVPGFTDGLKYAVVAGAVAGGGLTVIANAPNPAGQSILKKYFENGVSPVGLLKAAITPTIIAWLCFLVL